MAHQVARHAASDPRATTAQWDRGKVQRLIERPAAAHPVASAALGVLLIGLAVLLLSMLWVL